MKLATVDDPEPAIRGARRSSNSPGCLINATARGARKSEAVSEWALVEERKTLAEA